MSVLRVSNLGYVDAMSITEITDEALFSTPDACQMARVTFRQLDYWTRTGLIDPAQPANGSGSQRKYSGAQVRTIAMIGRLRDLGVSLEAIEEVLVVLDTAADGSLIVIGTESVRVARPSEIAVAIAAADGAAVVVSPDALKILSATDRGVDRCTKAPPGPSLPARPGGPPGR